MHSSPSQTAVAVALEQPLNPKNVSSEAVHSPAVEGCRYAGQVLDGVNTCNCMNEKQDSVLERMHALTTTLPQEK